MSASHFSCCKFSAHEYLQISARIGLRSDRDPFRDQIPRPRNMRRVGWNSDRTTIRAENKAETRKDQEKLLLHSNENKKILVTLVATYERRRRWWRFEREAWRQISVTSLFSYRQHLLVILSDWTAYEFDLARGLLGRFLLAGTRF